MKHWMFSCKDVSQKVSQSMDVELPFYQRMAVRMHLLMCRYCARFYRQLIMLRKMSRHIDGGPPDTKAPAGLSQDAKERLKKTLHAYL
ncbi:zf-HC2 domain-containing protein [Thermodesulfobacteriota bacterium]